MVATNAPELASVVKPEYRAGYELCRKVKPCKHFCLESRSRKNFDTPAHPAYWVE